MVSKTRVSISKTMSIVSSVQKVGVSISLRLSLTLAIISKTISSIVASIVASIAKVSKSISTISTIEKVGVSFSLGLGLRLSKGNSGQKGNSNSLQHLLASPSSDQQRIPMYSALIPC